jgi:hypothetical protein
LILSKCYYIDRQLKQKGVSLEPPLAFTDALTQLKLLTSQGNNFAFTDDELTQALTEAWNDTNVGRKVTDSSVSFVMGTFTYSKPATLDTISAIWVQYATGEPKRKLDRHLYTFPTDGTFEFIDDSRRWLQDNLTLYLVGRHKLTTDDSLDTTALVNYVLNWAAFLLLNRLALKYAFSFLKNDTSMSDILNARNAFQSNALMYKQALQREFEGI